MYRIDEMYRVMIEISSKKKTSKEQINYTGTIVEEDEIFVKINTIYGEEVILNKKDIIQSKQIKRVK